jgi:hypothetical protein
VDALIVTLFAWDYQPIISQISQQSTVFFFKKISQQSF